MREVFPFRLVLEIRFQIEARFDREQLMSAPWIDVSAWLLAVLILSAVGARQASAQDISITLTPFASGFNRPVGIVNTGVTNDDRLFIVEKEGYIRIVDSGVVQGTAFLDITSRVDDSRNEQGLLGLAFPPDYGTNGLFYVNYTYDPGPGNDRTRIASYQVSSNPNTAYITETVIMEFEQTAGNHNGGDMHFGPKDGYLYISSGDGGGDSDDAQDNTLPLGKILRIDVDTTGGADCDVSAFNNYGIPAGNLLADGPGGVCDEIWATGLRNPWRFSFDRQTADMWIADVGQSSWEEVDFQAASSTGGENYGWNCYEGDHVFSGGCPALTYTFPVHEYARGGSPFRCSITGGYVYRGTNPNLSRMQGYYLFADYCGGNLWALNSGDFSQVSFPEFVPGDPTTFGEDIDGELYIAIDGSIATVYQITQADPTAVTLQTTWTGTSSSLPPLVAISIPILVSLTVLLLAKRGSRQIPRT